MLEKIEHSNPQATPVASFEYDYNLDGLRTKVTREDDSYIEYTYDDLNRLTKEEAKNSGGTMQWKREYTYDAAGNRTEIDKDDGSGTTTYTYSYNNLKQLSTVQWSSYQKEYTYDDNGNLATMNEQHNIGMGYVTDIAWTYTWDVQDRLTSVAKDDQTVSDDDLLIEYEYCATCGGALSERIEYDHDSGGDVVSWLRYEYEGLNLLRIDEKYDSDEDETLEDTDAWRPLNVFVHAPGSIGQIVRSKWYNYRDCTTTPCDSGYYYYFYDALGNVAGVYDENTDEFIDYEMDAFGNDLPGGNAFLAMDQPGPKEHLTGKMYDTDTGLYYFHARWYDPEVGRFVSRDPLSIGGCSSRISRSKLGGYIFAKSAPVNYLDPNGKWGYTASCTHEDISRLSAIEQRIKNNLEPWMPFCDSISSCSVVFMPYFGIVGVPESDVNESWARDIEVECWPYCECIRLWQDKVDINCTQSTEYGGWLDLPNIDISMELNNYDLEVTLIHELAHICHGPHNSDDPEIQSNTECDPSWIDYKYWYSSMEK